MIHISGSLEGKYILLHAEPKATRVGRGKPTDRSDELAEAVNQKITEGWTPLGGPTVRGLAAVQAMTKL